MNFERNLIPQPECVTYTMSNFQTEAAFSELIKRRYGVATRVCVGRDDENDALFVQLDGNLSEEEMDKLDGLHPDEFYDNAASLVSWLFGIPTFTAVVYCLDGDYDESFLVKFEIPWEVWQRSRLGEYKA